MAMTNEMKYDDVPIGKIVIQGRIRENMKDIKSLAESILNNGIIHPIVIDGSNMKLVAGGRRITACNMALMLAATDPKYQHIFTNPLHPAHKIVKGLVPVILRSSLTDRELRILELEENLRRENLEWTEEVAALAQIDALAKETNEESQAAKGIPVAARKDWTYADTAAKLGRSEDDVQSKVAFAKRLGQAAPEVKVMLANLPLSRAMQKLEQIEDTSRIQRMAASGQITYKRELQLMSCQEYVKTLADASVDLVLMDPPFGIQEIDDNIGRTAGTSVLYTADLKAADNLTPDKAILILQQLAPDLARVLKPGALFLSFFGMDIYQPMVDAFRSVGLWVDPQPIIWNKMRTTNKFSGYKFCPCYEPILMGGRPLVGKKPGESGCCRRLNEIPKFSLRKIIECSPVSSGNRIHAFQKPLDLLVNLIKVCTQPGETVCDFFAGSGATIKAAYECGRTGIGCEPEPEHFAQAQGYLLEVDQPLITGLVPRAASESKA
jgi:DNA modification methylase/ParB-like chromosome segregation protein Spo0J